MNFHAIDERPFTAPRPGVPRLLLGFAALSLLLHTLLLIPGDDSAPLNISQLGAPYIRTILSNGPAVAANDKQMPDAGKSANKPPATQQHEARQDAPTSNKIKIPRSQPAKAREGTVPTPATTEIREPANIIENINETSAEALEKPSGSVHPGATRQIAPAAENRIGETTENTAQTDITAQRNYLLGQLQDQLSRYLSYPLRARRRGWEGEVLLGLRLDGDGQLHNIHLLRSSGYALLDRSALKALARVERLRLPADAPALQPVDLQLPVIYRLSES